MHCREILFTPRCSPRATEFPRSVNFSLRHRVAELWGVRVAQFLDFGLFSPYKTLKTYLYLSVISLQSRGYIAQWFQFFHVIVEGPKVLLPAPERRFPGTSGRGAGDRKHAQIFTYGKWLYPYRMQLHGASDLDQRCMKTRNSKDGCTFPPNIFAPTPKITQKPNFREPFNAKSYTNSSP